MSAPEIIDALEASGVCKVEASAKEIMEIERDAKSELEMSGRVVEPSGRR